MIHLIEQSLVVPYPPYPPYPLHPLYPLPEVSGLVQLIAFCRVLQNAKFHSASALSPNYFNPSKHSSNKYPYFYNEILFIMGKAIVKLNIATYAGEEYVVEVPYKKGDVDELIVASAWKKLKQDEGGSIPYGVRSAKILKLVE